jgi:hypothetical protein
LAGCTRDYWWRVRRFIRDLWILVPLVLVPVVLLVALLQVTSLQKMSSTATTAAALVGALTTLGVFAHTSFKAFRRHAFLFAAEDDKALLRTRDPMADLQARYSFLLRSARGPVVVLIDNLDRCHATYVVELLEGIQTLLKHRPEARGEPLVAFIVAADETWLCSSFVEHYDDLARSSAEPGRPDGLDFLDKVFDYAIRLPTVPAMISRPSSAEADRQCSLAEERVEQATEEIEIRRIVVEAERASAGGDGMPLPLQDLRLAAVSTLGELEDLFGGSSCADTTWQLEEMVARFDAAGAVRSRLHAGYCVQRTAQLLGGHEIDHDEHAIRRLALWTILKLRWPLVAAHLSAHPEDVECLRKQTAPLDCPEHLAPVFRSPCASQVALGWPGVVELTEEVVRRYVAPTPTPPPEFASAPPSCSRKPEFEPAFAGRRDKRRQRRSGPATAGGLTPAPRP